MKKILAVVVALAGFLGLSGTAVSAQCFSPHEVTVKPKNPSQIIKQHEVRNELIAKGIIVKDHC